MQNTRKTKIGTCVNMLSKSDIRTKVQQDINRLSQEEKQKESREVCADVIKILCGYSFDTLVSYTAFEDEVDTEMIHMWCRENNKTLFIVPQSSDKISIPNKSIIIVPGRAFTRDGTRIGRGK